MTKNQELILLTHKNISLRRPINMRKISLVSKILLRTPVRRILHPIDKNQGYKPFKFRKIVRLNLKTKRIKRKKLNLNAVDIFRFFHTKSI